MDTERIKNNRYELLKKLGQGGFGITYLAVDRENGQKVVVKKYAPGDPARQKNNRKKCLREARIMAGLKPVPEIARVLNYFEEDQTACIVMEYVPGTSLRDYLECLDQPMSFCDAVRMLIPVMDALEKVHKRNILHRDLSPDNLLVRENGSLCVIDFGSARAYDAYDRTKTVLLKNGYAPPEQYAAHGKQRPWTDVYGLCAVLYEMITGVIPQDAFSRADKDQLYLPSMYGAEITPEEEQTLLKGLALDYKERYSSMTELKEALSFEKKSHNPGRKRRKNLWIGAAALLLVLLGGTGIWIKYTWISPEQSGAVYAGNYSRGSREAGEFLSFVKENAAASVKEEDGILYSLDQETVLEYGLPCNQFRLAGTIDELEMYLKEAGWEYTKSVKKASCQVLVGDFDSIKTDFRKQSLYRIGNTHVLTVDHDVVDGSILNVQAELVREGDKLPWDLAAGLLRFLAGDLDGGKDLEEKIRFCDEKYLDGEYKQEFFVSVSWKEAVCYFQKADEDGLRLRFGPQKGGIMVNEFAWWP